jgi:SecD/SecF fusion protein
MSGKYTWKLIVSLLAIAWAAYNLVPLRDTKFQDYVQQRATGGAEWDAIYKKATARVESHQDKTFFVALRSVAEEDKVDLAKFFPFITLEKSLANPHKRNAIVLDGLLRRSRGKIQFGLDLNGGVSFTLEVDRKAGAGGSDDVRKQELEKAIEIIHQRIDTLGVSEPIIRPIGQNRIEVQLANISTKDNPDIVDVLKKPARLEFRLVNMEKRPENTPPDEVPPDCEEMILEDERGGRMIEQRYFVKRRPEMTGKAVKRAGVQTGQFGEPSISLQFTSEGGEQFAEVTGRIAEASRGGPPGQLAIVLDGKLYSAPTVKEKISGGNASISGRFTDREAFELANVLNNPLDLPLRVVEMSEVGPSLAQDAIDSGVKAAVIGTVLVAAFMITYYTTGGLVSVFTLGINVAIIFGWLASIGATITMPGLAGIVLTIGMAVDANILIFERMREERAAGMSLKAATQYGYVRALTTILDAHIVQLIICAIMIWLGTGPIKGFGVTLAIGVLSTLLSVLITAHLIMEYLVDHGILKKLTMRQFLKNWNVDFVKIGKPAFIGSWMIVLLGVGVVIYKGSGIYGIDFAGGDVVEVNFRERVDEAKIRQIGQSHGVGEVSAAYISDIGGGKETLKIETPEGKSGPLMTALREAFPTAGLETVSERHVGATIGKEIEFNALLAVGVSMMTILVYIAFRFEFGFGIGAMFSTLHDILMTIGIFVLTGHQFSAPMVAAILCIAGYSINETVVVFDRIREELKLNPNASLRVVVNMAIHKVFARTIVTATTTFLAALSLYIFGAGVLRDISFTFLVGIVTSTFSAIFIAAQVFYWWHKGDRKHVEAHRDIAPKYEWAASSRAAE